MYLSQHAVSLARPTMPMATAACRGAPKASGIPDFHLGKRSVLSCPSQHMSDAAAVGSMACAERLPQPCIAHSTLSGACSVQLSSDGTAIEEIACVVAAFS